MAERSPTPATVQDQGWKTWLTPHGIALILIWLIAAASYTYMLVNGVRGTGRYRLERDIIQGLYVLVLIWYLFKSGPALQDLPEIKPQLLPQSRLGPLIPGAILAFLLVTEFYDQGLLQLLIILSAIWILVAWRRELSLSAFLLSLAIGAIAFLGGLPLLLNVPQGSAINYYLLLLIALPMFVAGGLLSQRTRLVGSQFYHRQYLRAGMSFLGGCLLYIPLGLANAASGSPGMRMAWVDRWWIPLSQPLFSGLVEEIWYRLFLVSLGYYLLRPAFKKYPAIAIACSALFSGITFGLGHGGTLLEKVLYPGLLFGVPLAITFTRRDWEHSAGGHYMINMIPTLMLFLEH